MRELYLSVSAKLWTFICVLIAVSFGRSVILSLLLALLCFLQLAVQKKYRILRSYGLFYMVLGVLMYAIRYHGFHMLVFSEFNVLMFWSLSPIILISWDLLTTPPGELSAFFSKMHAPTSVILGLLVIFRFFPTMRSELKGIWLSMKNRGLTDPKHMMRHPVTTCEYVFVPFLFRILMTADRLSVSAVARGAQNPGVRGSYYEKKMEISDLIVMMLWFTVTVLYFLFGGIRI